ncbi:helix-turn-helix transcriptional regulator [Actinacidiphila sp. ITFR-21]|uniref:helix-turn-helix transcriptional regulator n=1 Tax=Actinacidiphila sp. ITFR-21 TaxID=3075199 RepID=UPI00288B4D10|nr:helix-turn-helix domain-containing protein [Streptomyces sp. ITFR-21]WNI19836.1 helix-turn-helix domain-containing protein [Streptomyces sp. ITFR-21]
MQVVAALLTVRGAATYLGISESTLYVWRHRRTGPPGFRLGRRGRVMYRRTALDRRPDEQEASDSRSNATLSPLAQATRSRS